MVQTVWILSIISIFSAVQALDKRLPEDFKRCSQNSAGLNDCLKNAVPDALRKMIKGIPDLNVPRLEPLSVSTIDIQTGSGPVSIRQVYNNIKILGLTNSTLLNYNADLKQYTLITDSFTPSLEFISDYVMSGRILLLPIQGKGRCNFTMADLVVKHVLVGEPVTKKGQVYMKIRQYDIKLIPKKISFYFSNLFNGDKALGEQMNRFLNENSEIVFNELKPSYEQSFSLLFKDITNKIFTKVPMDHVFPIEKEN
ncbi:protein takeout-like [Arctopsyche grandis]|uniref:protein takeout-like n=1 Tax=Arctopsyche grandis TaxID=121162 RepID=UPI00406D94C6